MGLLKAPLGHVEPWKAAPGPETGLGGGVWVSHPDWVMPATLHALGDLHGGEQVSNTRPWGPGHKSLLSEKQWSGA